ncbi:hypothetical protein D3C74_167040 [compost metagenome]
MIRPLGRRFFWVKSTGNIVAQRNEMSEGIESTKEEDFAVYVELRQYDPEAIEMTTFEHGQYVEDFVQATSWRFDPETGEIVFSYPDPNDPEPQEPAYRKPLSVQVQALESDLGNLLLENAADKATMATLEDTVGNLLLELAALKGGA